MNISRFVKENRAMVYSAIVAGIAILLVLIFIHKEIDRFIFIMPIFAGWILFNILMLPDEETDLFVNDTTTERVSRKSKSK